jgi:hypothetical protein
MNFKSFKSLKMCLMIEIKYLTRKFLYKSFILKLLFGPFNTFMRKGKDLTDPEHRFLVSYTLVIPHWGMHS